MNHLSTSAPSTSSTRIISGSTPGLLDPLQSRRVLRYSHSKLSFAYHDPRTASAHHATSGAHDLSGSRRVVIEMTGDIATWKFVPKALLEQGVVDEGQWPRVVDICGELVECSQDQWDIYKLDCKYECRVRLPPALSTITLATPSISSTKQEVPHINGKHQNATIDNTFPRLVPRKKFHRRDSPLTFHLSLSEDEIDESEVEEMIVDQPPARSRSAAPGSNGRSKRFREQISRNRQARRERLARRAEKLAQQDEVLLSTSHEQPIHGDENSSPDAQSKRKVTSLFPFHDTHYVNPTEEERNMKYYEHTTNSKRARTLSPMTAKRDLDAKRHRRAKQKQRSRQAKIRDRRERWNEQFMREIFAEVPELRETRQNDPNNESDEDEDEEEQEGGDESSGESESDAPFQSWDEVDEAAAREAAIAESRRKLAELEKDRPLWEAEAHKRALREKAEEEAARLRREQNRWAEGRFAETQRQKRAEEARKRQVDPRVHEERVRRQREKYARDRWSYGIWTNQRALERYKSLCESFDSTKFSEEEPLIWEAVPWPVLDAPRALTVECISWDAVEKFFNTAQRSMREQDFKVFVEKSHRRFHPDRWRARGILRTVANDMDRDSLQLAGNTVSQAITPIWMRGKER